MISLQAATGRQNLLDPSAELGVLLARNKLGSPGEGGALRQKSLVTSAGGAIYFWVSSRNIHIPPRHTGQMA